MKQFYFRPVLVKTPLETELQQMLEVLGESNRPLVDALIALLDGSNSLEEIYGRLLLEGVGLETSFTALSWLENQGLLQEEPSSAVSQLSEPEKVFYQSQMQALAHFQGQGGETSISGVRSGMAAQLALKEAIVVVVGCGMAGSSLIRSLALAGIGNLTMVNEHYESSEVINPNNNSELDSTAFQEEIERLNSLVQFTQVTQISDLPEALSETTPNLLIYCPDNFDETFCEWLNQVSLDYSLPLLVYRRRLFALEIGPLIIPRQTACYVCYDRRRKATNFDVLTANAPQDNHKPKLNFPLGTDLLALEVVKVLAGLAEPVTYGRLWRLNILSGLLEIHPILKLPRCPACGVHKVKPKHKLWEE